MDKLNLNAEIFNKNIFDKFLLIKFINENRIKLKK